MGTRQRTIIVLALTVAASCLSIGIGRPHEVRVDPGRARLVPFRVESAASTPGCDLPVAPPCPCPTVPVPVVGTPFPQDPPAPVVTLRVRVPSCANAGAEVEYRIMVENCSPAAAHHVLIRNPLPANARYVRAKPEPTRRTPELQWELGTLQGGAGCEIVLVLKAAAGADLTNCTRVQFEHGECVTTRIAGSAPPVPKAPSTKEPPTVPGGKAKLSLQITGPEQQYINIPTPYFITLKNTGTAAATNVLIANKVPDGTTFVRADQNGQFADGQVAWVLGTLEAGASKTVELVLGANSAGRICPKARAEADGGLKADAETCTVFKGASAVLPELIDRKDPIPTGGDTSYLITLVNQGHVPVTNIRIKALVPGGLRFNKADGPTQNKLGEKTAENQLVLFEPLASLEPGAKVEYEVFVLAQRPGDVRFTIEVTADQLKAGGPVRLQENTTIFPENGAAPPRPDF
jgi:uncharacterized repeat protein (TIGR01451 family)